MLESVLGWNLKISGLISPSLVCLEASGPTGGKHELEKYELMRVEAYNKNKKKYECKFCYTNYTKFSELVYHIELVHKSDLDKIEEKIITADLLRFSCDGCDLRKR